MTSVGSRALFARSDGTEAPDASFMEPEDRDCCQSTRPCPIARPMLELSCHCGRVRIHVFERPDYVHECNCSLCEKTGARWGYFSPTEVGVEGATAGYRRQDKEDPGAEVHFCATCGATTHFTLTESAVARFGNSLLGVNLRLVGEGELAGLELRYPDGRAWAGEGAFTYVREARIIGQE